MSLLIEKKKKYNFKNINKSRFHSFQNTIVKRNSKIINHLLIYMFVFY